MFDKLKVKIAETREFVKRNEIEVTAGVCTFFGFMVGAAYVHRTSFSQMEQFVYEMGAEHARQMTITTLCVDFIEKNDLETAFLDHSRAMLAEAAKTV